MRGGRTMPPPTVPRPPCPDAQGGLPGDTRGGRRHSAPATLPRRTGWQPPGDTQGGRRQGAPPQDAPARSAPAIPQRTGWPPPGDTQGGRHLTRTMPTASPVRTALIGRRQDAPARSVPPSHSFGHHPTRTMSTASPRPHGPDRSPSSHLLPFDPYQPPARNFLPAEIGGWVSPKVPNPRFLPKLTWGFSNVGTKPLVFGIPNPAILPEMHARRGRNPERFRPLGNAWLR